MSSLHDVLPTLTRSALLSAPLLATLLSGCPATVGDTCTTDDLARARQVAYTGDGQPAYAGQALLIASCGGNSYCHTQTPIGPSSQHFGAPADLVLDPMLVDGATDEEAASLRLLRAVSIAHRHRDEVYASVVTNTMPPAGRGSVPDLRGAASAYRTYASASDTTGTPLPAVNSAEGQEILRNWLACGSPVVERTTEPTVIDTCTSNADCSVTHACDMDLGECRPVGDVVARRGGGMTATWSSIYTTVIGPSCGFAGCHGGATPQAALDLSSAATAYTALTTGSAQAGGLCNGRGAFVTAGDPTMSLLVDKLAATPTCGGRMPPAGLSADTVALITQWVSDGAMNN